MTTDTPDLRAMVRRLEKLECENRKLRRGAVAVFALFGAAFVAGTSCAPHQPTAGENKIIEAEGLVLRDRQGRIRTQLAVGDNGPWFSLLDENGKVRAQLTAQQQSAWFNLFDEYGRSRLALGTDQNGVRLALSDREGKVLADLCAPNVDTRRALLDLALDRPSSADLPPIYVPVVMRV